MTDAFELDPERRLWKPNRRSFFFGLGAALIAPMLPAVPNQYKYEFSFGWSESEVRIYSINGFNFPVPVAIYEGKIVLGPDGHGVRVQNGVLRFV